jgi:hypothetical protein
MNYSVKNQKPPAANKWQDAATSFAEHDGRKQWLTRRDIRKEYGWSPKTTARIEHAPNSRLIPSIVGKNGGRTKRYFRPHIEAILHDSFVSVRVVTQEKEGI